MFSKRKLKRKLKELKNMSQEELKEELFKALGELKEHLEKGDLDIKPRFTISITTEHSECAKDMRIEVRGTKRDLMHGLAELSCHLLAQTNLDREDILSAVNMGIGAYYEDYENKYDVTEAKKHDSWED